MKDKTALLTILNQNSRLDTAASVRLFDEALAELAEPDVLAEHDLPALFAVFRDDTEQEEVMFGLVHLVEDFPLEQFVASFLEAVPAMKTKAPEWINTFQYRILNSDKARELMKRLLPSKSAATQQIIGAVLRQIASTEKPPLSTRAQAVLN